MLRGKKILRITLIMKEIYNLIFQHFVFDSFVKGYITLYTDGCYSIKASFMKYEKVSYLHDQTQPKVMMNQNAHFT